jgi:diguanylate cyclase (GGDEF)-like protein
MSEPAAVLADLWLQRVVRANFMPAGRARARAVLESLVRRLVGGLTAEPFDPAVGYRVGADLVATNISSPRALGETIALLNERLLVVEGASPARVAALLGQLATGYTEAMRNRLLSAAEGINRAERAAWRNRQYALQSQLQHALLHDPLTGLPNRASLIQRLRDVLAGADSGTRLGICLLSLDRFSAVTDSLGPDQGDQLLLAVARRLRGLATTDGRFLAHLGGDEFALLAERTTGSDEVCKLAEDVLRTVPDPFPLGDHHIPITARVGIVERAAAGAEPNQLLRAAYTTLRWTQADRRSRRAVFDQRRNSADLARHTLTAAMPAALDRGEFRLAYQPLVRLRDRKLVAVEALARWHHPVLGVLDPTEFIALAEDTGLIEPLGLYLLERACLQAATWQRLVAEPPLVSVNLAVAQLRQPELPAAVAAVLDKTGVPVELLQLEVTESAIVDTDRGTAATLASLADHGVRLAIDDFGTGYSCLAYLSELPVHAVKLAGRFLHGIDDPHPGHRSNSKILPALISLSHDLGLTITAEGVETSGQLRRLRDLGCDLGQGYLLGRPTTPENITRQLSPACTGSDTASM